VISEPEYTVWRNNIHVHNPGSTILSFSELCAVIDGLTIMRNNITYKPAVPEENIIDSYFDFLQLDTIPDQKRQERIRTTINMQYRIYLLACERYFKEQRRK